MPQDHPSVAPHFVRGMGLFSATAIVMGSMIGSGIFIVSADMARIVGSPALLIAAWMVTALMTLIGALSYGELAAMMPKRRRPVRLSARIARPALRISLRMDALPRHPDRDHRRGRRRLRKVPWRLLSLRQRQPLALAHRACAGNTHRPHGPRQYGHRPQHCESRRHRHHHPAYAAQHLRRKAGRVCAKCLHLRQSSRPRRRRSRRSRSEKLRSHRREFRPRLAQLLGRRWLAHHPCSAGRRRWPDRIRRPVDRSRSGSGRQPLQRRRVEQRHLHRRRD